MWGWDLVEWLERCASIPMITSSNPSGGSEVTFRSDLLLTARSGRTWALLVEIACLPCYPGNTLCSQRLEPAGRAGIGAMQIPKFIYLYFLFYKGCFDPWIPSTFLTHHRWNRKVSSFCHWVTLILNSRFQGFKVICFNPRGTTSKAGWVERFYTDNLKVNMQLQVLLAGCFLLTQTHCKL
jgi:hypothetical protein